MKHQISTPIAEQKIDRTAENEWTQFWPESSSESSKSSPKTRSEITEPWGEPQPLYTESDVHNELAESALENWRSKSWVKNIDSKRKTLLKKIEALFPANQSFWPYNGELIHGPSVRRLITLGPLEVHEKKHTVVFKSSRHNAFGRVITQYTFEVGKIELGPMTKIIQDLI